MRDGENSMCKGPGKRGRMARYEPKRRLQGLEQKEPSSRAREKGRGQRIQALLALLERDDFLLRQSGSLRNLLSGVEVGGSWGNRSVT